ncbi:MAG: PIG-L family deacetylase [Candidatus Eisenbacteria bacterium]
MTDPLLEHIVRQATPVPRSILWVGHGRVPSLSGGPLADSRVTILPTIPNAFDHRHEFDAIVIADGFEHDPWPRWALQRAHRCLKQGGTLVLQSRRPGALGSPQDLAAAARRLAFSGRRFLHKRMHPERMFPGVAPDTRLSDDELRTILESLHYRLNIGPEPARGALRRLVATTLPSLYETGSSAPFPDAARHRLVHEQALASDFARRDAWAVAHPRWAPAHPEPLDPSGWTERTIVVLSPHPDDEIIGCGGTLLRAKEAGAKVICIQASDGSAGAALAHLPESIRQQRRLDEALEVGHKAGFTQVTLWREDNRHFTPGPERAAELARLFREQDVATVFVPFVTDIHPDHQALAHLLAAAIESAPDAFDSLTVAQYEVWSCAWPTHVVDVTRQAQQLEELLCVYDTALRIDDYVHLCERRNYYNSLVHGGGAGYAEILNQVPAREYPELVRAGCPR